MRPAWYVLLYHDVSWEESPFLRGIGGMVCPPDVFRDHLEHLGRLGRLVCVPEGLERAARGALDRPLFSIWFDDGYAGVPRYALPILREFGVDGACSVCSRFVLRRELFWRAKLSYLAYVDGLRFLRSRLRRLGLGRDARVRDFTLDRFSDEVLDDIEAVFERFTSPEMRRDAFRLFAGPDDLRRLRAEGWLLANHTAAHHPVGEDGLIDRFEEQFSECESLFEDLFQTRSGFWVLPFDRRRSARLFERFEECAGPRRLVLVGNRANDPQSLARRRIHRITAPICPGEKLVSYLRRL